MWKKKSNTIGILSSLLSLQLLSITLFSHPSEKPCFALQEPTFSDQIDRACQDFKQKDDYNRYCRYACYSLLGTGLFLAIFRNTFPPVNRIQEQLLHAKVQELDDTMKKMNRDVQQPTITYGQALIGFFKPFFDYTIKVFTPGSMAAYLIDKVVGNFAYGITLPIVEPFQRFMNIQRSVAVGDAWFLREQVRNAPVSFVVVSTDLYNFIDELKTLDLELRHIMLLATLLAATTNSPRSDDILQSSQQYIKDRLARIIGHIAYMRTKATDFEKLALKMLYPRVRNSLEIALREFITAYSSSDLTVMKQTITTFEQAIKCALLPLLSISLYRIHPWPAMVACTEQMRAASTASFVATYGNPASS